MCYLLPSDISDNFNGLIFLEDASKAEEVIFGHYVICNDTQQPIRFGQVGTDENLVLQPREMHQYGWRTHKMKQVGIKYVQMISWPEMV